MMSDIPPKLPTTAAKDTHQHQGSSAAAAPRKPGGGTGRASPQDHQGMKCPRCDSPNTKFCYYNNYSLTQPRHFCKSCRRYWTKGGALRNVPIGGGCRKNNKKLRSSRLTSSSCDSASSSSDLSGLKFLHGLAAASSPSLDFHLGGGGLPFPSRLHHHPPPPPPVFSNNNNQFSNSFGEVSAACSSSFSLDPTCGLNYPFCPPPSSSSGFGANGIIQGMSSMNVHGSLASSIESLSSMNQDLHWKLQQQRLAMLFGGDNNQNQNQNQKDVVAVDDHENEKQKPQPILFHSLEPNLKEGGGSGPPMEWFFGNPTGGGGSNWGGGGGGGWGGDHVLHQQYSALP